MNEFLKTRNDIEIAGKYLEENGLLRSGLSCKDWELYKVLPFFKDGNWVDVGSDGSIVLENLTRKNIVGFKAGIDLAYPENIESPEGLNLVKGDLMQTPFPDNFFDYATSLSVIEHEVDFSRFAKEVSRVLKNGGKLFVSFDYWNPKPEYEKRKLYSLDWNILDENDVKRLIIVLAENGLVLNGEIDWTLQDAVINENYCSPVKGVSYSFGILSFIKQ